MAKLVDNRVRICRLVPREKEKGLIVFQNFGIIDFAGYEVED